jgi:protein phosphatase-4 regulatory subunit 3
VCYTRHFFVESEHQSLYSDDPEFPLHKANYREFLHQSSHFHQPIPIRDDLIQRKIHYTYRLQFLKDVVLARALDDSTFNVLNSCIIFNQIDIITYVQQDPTLLNEVVGLYVDESMLSGGGVKPKEDVKIALVDALNPDAKPGGETKVNGVQEHGPPSRPTYPTLEDHSEEAVRLRREVVLLIQQLCVMGKNVQLPARMALFRTLVDRGILFAVQWALSLPEKEESSKTMICAAGEIVAVLLDHDLHGVRAHVLKHVAAIERERNAGKKGADKAETVLALLCRMLAGSQDLAVQSQVGDALRVLMEVPQGDSETVGCRFVFVDVMYTQKSAQTLVGPKLLARRDEPGTEKFLEFFYKHCIEILFRPFFTDVPEFKNLTGELVTPSTFTILYECLVVEPLFILSREKTNLYLYLCDLLCNFALQHSFRSHFYILSSNIAIRVSSLLRTRDKHLRLGRFALSVYPFTCSCCFHSCLEVLPSMPKAKQSESLQSPDQARRSQTDH